MRKYKELITIGVYLVSFVLILCCIKQIWINNLFDNSNFLNYDAEHYNYIMQYGYKGFRVAFFPLFPLIWRFLSVNVYGIVIVNSLVFLTTFYILIRSLKISNVYELLLYLSIPSFIFFYLPYSESIFFISSVVLLMGLKYNRNIFVYIGLFLATLSRPVFVIFVPALVIVELLRKGENKSWFRLILYFLIAAVGVLLVGLIQYHDTGAWFEFYSAQKGWGNQLQIPKLPLTSWDDGLVVRTDGIAFLIGLLSGLYLIALIFKIKPFYSAQLPPKEVVFSLSYLGGITLSVLLFRGGSLFSLNRFVFAVPFIIVVLHYWINQKFTFSVKQLLYIYAGIFLFWLLFGSYVHILITIKYLLISLYVVMLFVIKSDKLLIRKYGWRLFLLANIAFQLIFYLRFLNGQWIG
jgi:hypothetical protein